MKKQDLIYCMGHGVGVVVNTETKEFGGDKVDFIHAKIVKNGMTLMIPENKKKNQYRRLLNQKKIDEIYEFLSQRDYKADNSTWNRRHRDYLARVKSLDHLEVSSVLRDLMVLEKTKKLSFGERKMKEQVIELLSNEIHYVTKQNQSEIENSLLS